MSELDLAVVRKRLHSGVFCDGTGKDDFCECIPALLDEVESLREKEAEARARSTYWKKQHDKRRDETNKATQKAYYAEQKRQAEEKNVDRIHQWLLETRVERDHLRKRLAKAEGALKEIGELEARVQDIIDNHPRLPIPFTEAGGRAMAIARKWREEGEGDENNR